MRIKHLKVSALALVGMLVSAQFLCAQHRLKHVNSISVGEEEAAEIVAFDAVNNYSWVLNSPNSSVDCYDITNVLSPQKIGEFSIAPYGAGVNSVDVFDTIVALAIEADPKTDAGTVLLIGSKTHAVLAELMVGALPDMLTFNHSGSKLLVACEGEPNDDYSIDPLGAISIISVPDDATLATVENLDFSAFNSIAATLINNGVRISGPGATLAQDVEPEYISVTEDDSYAYVTLQENNAVAVVDLMNDTIIDILPLGFKDHSTGKAHLKEYVINELANLPSLGTGLKGEITLGGFSGLYYNPLESRKDVHVFYAVPDRGPNLDPIKGAVDTAGNPASGSLRPFLTPNYASRIVKFTVNEMDGTVTFNENDQIFLTGSNGETITGRGNIEGPDEVPVYPATGDDTLTAKYHIGDMYYQELAYDSLGGDFEGVLLDKYGNFWLCDENRPSVYKFTSSGELIARYVAEGTSQLGVHPKDSGYYGTETLPESYSSRWANRGFEAIAYNPDSNLIYAFIQSPLYFPNSSTKGKSDVIRILALNADNGMPVAEYVYLLDRVSHLGVADQITDKIGDAVYKGNGKFLVIERDSRGPGSKASKKYVYEINLKGATNVLDSTFARSKEVPKTLEQMSAEDLAAIGVKPVFKRAVINLPSVGYLPSDKSEGIAILPGGKIAVINDNDFGLNGAGITDSISLGIISFDNANKLIASDKRDNFMFRNEPLLGLLMPDAIGSYMVDGINYFVIANEGDGREYGDYVDEARVKDVDLDTILFPNADSLQGNGAIGRINTVLTPGWSDLDGDGRLDNIFTFGGRSFSIFDQYGNLVFDSGSDLGEITIDQYPGVKSAYTGRLDNKGVEPEAMAIGKVGDKTYAFIGLERTSGVMVYDITNPKHAQFVQYINTYDFASETGDAAPEGMKFVPAEKSPTGEALLLVAHEVSGTLAIFSFEEVSKTADFAVASDLHYMSPSLLVNNGTAFQSYLMADRKLLAESKAITEELINEWLMDKPDFVLISGDLTKDGEQASHEELAAYFAQLEAAGISVYVTPGNHDINNPHAVSFDGADMTPVAHVTPEQFMNIYDEYGYNEALARHSNSLSYMVEPKNGLRVLALDVCKYDTNITQESPETSGAISEDLLTWIKEQIADAKANGDEIIAFMHHGIVEHYAGHGQFFPEYMVDKWDSISKVLADEGLTAVFTGHSHAQDIVRTHTRAGNVLYDIQTGSTVTYPCPYRMVSVVNDTILEIRSKRITSIDFDTHGKSFQQYAKEYLEAGLPILVTYMLTTEFGLSEGEVAMLEPAITRAYLAHYQGNEGEASENDMALQMTLMSSENPLNVMFGKFLYSVWHDPMPNDWNVSINLKEMVEPYKFPLQLLHASDLEGGVEAIGRAANFAAIIDALEDAHPNSITISAGDNYIPGPFFGAASDFGTQPILRDVFAGYYGDTVNTSNLRAASGRIDISIMNIIGFDASAIGNHEFDAGTSVMSGNVAFEKRDGEAPRWLGTQFPYVCSNLDFSADENLGWLFTDSIRPNEDYNIRPSDFSAESFAKKIAPATIIERGGERIGLVGATTQMVEQISSTGNVTVKGGVGNNMAILATEVQKYVDALTNAGIDKIIVVSHLQQIALEKELIGLLHNVDISIAGGSDVLMANEDDVLHPGHEIAEPYPFITENADGQPAILLGQDGQYSYVGRLVVEFDRFGVIDTASIASVSGAYASTLEVVETLWADSATAFAPNTKGEFVSCLVTAVKNIVTSQDGNIFGKTDVYLEGERTKVRTEETNFGNLSADANLWVAQQFDTAVVVSIKNGGGIRAAIGEVVETAPGVYSYLPPQANALSGKQEGEISQLDIANSLRFNNTLTIVPITAEGLKAVVEHGVAAWEEGATPGQFCQVGGIEFSFDPSLPAGERVQKLVIVDEAGAPVDNIVLDGEVYGDATRPIKVVTLNFLAGGGDGYPFANLADEATHISLTDTLNNEGSALFAAAGSEQDALAEYLLEMYSTTAFAQAETEATMDERIQNLMYRTENIDIVDTTTTQTSSLAFSASNVEVYPTISTGSVTIENADGANLTILTANGTTLLQTAVIGELYVLNGLPKGSWLVIVSVNGQKTTKAIVVE